MTEKDYKLYGQYTNTITYLEKSKENFTDKVLRQRIHHDPTFGNMYFPNIGTEIIKAIQEELEYFINLRSKL